MRPLNSAEHRPGHRMVRRQSAASSAGPVKQKLMWGRQRQDARNTNGLLNLRQSRHAHTIPYTPSRRSRNIIELDIMLG